MAESQQGNGGAKRSRTALWIILILIVVGAAAVFIVHNLGQYRLAQARSAADVLLATRTEELVKARAVSMARSMAVLSRQAMDTGQFEFLQESLDDLVREPGVLSITILDPDQIAIVATDRKVLGAAVTSADAAQAVSAQEPTISPGKIYFPIMGFTRRLGTLRLQYDPEATEFIGSSESPETAE
jgi:hypothetical protein